ncbi:MAG: sodium:calcium antiporter [Marinobacter sp.]|uniref:sodium:calcium antiporter n=1 Tax=Marinobacter sp. TaxID=50741 RepID=UPI00299D8E99|nr:sodium:calcium antiporter [Marinobacter sp.]MDX1757042.1 sodium:calcium antiporter [Marinobacter sp.]
MSVALFLLAAGLIAYFGIKMTYVSRDLAAMTRIGEAVMGAVFIGAATSLSGLVASATAASNGLATLAVSNSLGGIAAQTLFLVLGDLVYRKANLEFAAASVENMMMSAQLLLLLCILLIAFTIPSINLASVHPASLVLIVTYLFTVKMLVDTHQKPMWLPRMSPGTIQETKQRASTEVSSSKHWLVMSFFGCAFMVGFAGWLITSAGMELVERGEMSSSVVGGIFIAISTSLPELVIAITAIRAGALTLAVGDIVGGNAFDTLFVAVSDIFYREGSIFTAITDQEQLWLGTAMSMNALLLLGLLYRERKGIANIGVESAAILLVYFATVLYLCL